MSGGWTQEQRGSGSQDDALPLMDGSEIASVFRVSLWESARGATDTKYTARLEGFMTAEKRPNPYLLSVATSGLKRIRSEPFYHERSDNLVRARTAFGNLESTAPISGVEQPARQHPVRSSSRSFSGVGGFISPGKQKEPKSASTPRSS